MPSFPKGQIPPIPLPSLPLPLPLPGRRVALVLQEFVRLLHACGMPAADADIITGRGAAVNEVLLQGEHLELLINKSSIHAARFVFIDYSQTNRQTPFSSRDGQATARLLSCLA